MKPLFVAAIILCVASVYAEDFEPITDLVGTWDMEYYLQLSPDEEYPKDSITSYRETSRFEFFDDGTGIIYEEQTRMLWSWSWGVNDMFIVVFIGGEFLFSLTPFNDNAFFFGAQSIYQDGAVWRYFFGIMTRIETDE